MSLAATTESRLVMEAASSATAYAELVGGMRGLVVTLAGRAMGKRHNSLEVREEVEAEATAALCVAVRTYAAKQHGRFATYAGRRMVRAAVSYLRTGAVPAGVGTAWLARQQQSAKHADAWLGQVLGAAATQAELEYVTGSPALAGAAAEVVSVVPIVDVEEDLPGLPPEAEDGAERRFFDRWISLSHAQQVLVTRAEQLGEGSGGVSLSVLSAEFREPRSAVVARLGDALSVLTVDPEAQ